MEDIVPVLYARILKTFQNRIKNDKKIQTFERKLADKTATASEVSLCAADLGRIAAAVLGDALDPDNLPNRQLYRLGVTNIVNFIIIIAAGHAINVNKYNFSVILQPTESTTYRIILWQNSGSSINAWTDKQVIKLF